MQRRLFLGIDVSTTSAKALLIDEAGGVVASAATPLSISTPCPLWSEQDSHEWWEGVAGSRRAALAQLDAGGAEGSVSVRQSLLLCPEESGRSKHVPPIIDGRRQRGPRRTIVADRSSRAEKQAFSRQGISAGVIPADLSSKGREQE